jgi:ribosomal 50S subunit-recycling heat shock protein
VRLDLFLKTSRLIKQRSVAKAACEKGRIRVDGRVAKASHQVRPGERLTITSPTRELEVEVLEIPQGSVSRARARELYRSISERRLDELWPG